MKPKFALPALCILFLSSCAPAVVTHNNTGNDRYAQGAYEAAITEYRQAQVADPDRPEPYYNAANAFNRQGEITATLAQTQQALKTAGDDLAAQTWYNLGNAYFDAEQWAAAINAYQETLRLRPDDLDAKHNLELALKQQQSQQKQAQQDGENQPSEEEDPSQGGQPTPTPGAQEKPSAGQNEPTPQPSGQPDETEGMTPEQARQLLQAIVGESQTLQERLGQIYRVPAPPPEEDW